MRTDVQTKQTTLALSEPFPPEIAVGADIGLSVRVSCLDGSDLSGGSVQVVVDGVVVATPELVTFDEGGDFSETEEFAVKAPEQLGEHAWRVVFPSQRIDGVAYAESSLPISFRTKPQVTSLAVWAVPSPVMTGKPFQVKVGVKSTAACELKGVKVEIEDEAGAPVGGGSLGGTPWQRTGSLYWTEIELTAPVDEGVYSWSVRCAGSELALPHSGASAKFSFATARPPEHTVRVKAVVKDTENPIEGVRVRVGAFQCSTHGTDPAVVEVPKGLHRLAAWKAGYEAFSRTVEVTEDIVLQVELVPQPDESPYAEWRQKF